MDYTNYTPSGSQRKIAGLDCTVVDTKAGPFDPKAIVVLCHGFGAGGDDLVPLGSAMSVNAAGSVEDIRFVFPAAPIQLDPTGFYDSRAWWQIDMEKLQEMMLKGEFRDLRNECNELLPERRKSITELITVLADESGLGMDRVVIGGFSQGSMVATDVALHLDGNLGGLIVWSGTLTNEQVWRERAPSHEGLNVVQTHGRFDPVLPFVASEWLFELFEQNRYNVNYLPFDGQHEIPPSAMRAGANLISSVVAK